MRKYALLPRVSGANHLDRRGPPAHKSASAVVAVLVSFLGMACAVSTPTRGAMPGSGGSVWMVATAWLGTGLLAPSGEVTASARQVVRMADCRVVPKPSPRRWGQADDTPPPHTYSVLALDSDCVIAAEEGVSFSPKEGQMCALTVGGVRRVIRVTDVAVRHPLSRFARYGAAFWNRHELDVHLGGDDVASGQHVAYEFSGRTVDDVAPLAICSSARDPLGANGL
jgi:hypothetical protein